MSSVVTLLLLVRWSREKVVPVAGWKYNMRSALRKRCKIVSIQGSNYSRNNKPNLSSQIFNLISINFSNSFLSLFPRNPIIPRIDVLVIIVSMGERVVYCYLPANRSFVRSFVYPYHLQLGDGGQPPLVCCLCTHAIGMCSGIPSAAESTRTTND